MTGEVDIYNRPKIKQYESNSARLAAAYYDKLL